MQIIMHVLSDSTRSTTLAYNISGCY